jgi:putative transposase
MSKRRIFDAEPFAHFVTFSVSHRRRLLDHDHPKRILLGVLNSQLEAFQSRCIGYVVMPDHVHAILWLPKSGQLTRFMHGWKRMSSFNIRRWYRHEAPNYFADFGEGDRFWMPKYYSFEIYRTQKLEEKLTYMHLNAVRAGLVEKAVDWKWSSARLYEQHGTAGVPIVWVD